MVLHYQDHLQGIQVQMLEGFFQGFLQPPSPTDHLRLLQNSQYIYLAVNWEEGQVVGFVTAITDRVLAAYIPLLEVLPKYQGQGIGRTLMGKIFHKLKHLSMVDCTCDEQVQSFYEKMGMRRHPGMMIRRGPFLKK